MKRALAFLLGGMLTAVAPPASAETLVIHADRVIADASKPPLGPTTIVVSGNKIVAVRAGFLPAADAASLVGTAGSTINPRLIDLRGKTVLPGLIDSHVHLTSDPGGAWWQDAVVTDPYKVAVGIKNARITVRAGFTTVRDLGSSPDVGHAVRDAINNGLVPGPRVLSSGPGISIIGGHMDVSRFRPEVLDALQENNTCTGADQCASRVREASRGGADVIKIAATGGVLSQQARGLDKHFTDAELKALVTTAHSLGLKVATHAHGPRGVEAAAKAGVDSIEHGTLADEAAVAAMAANGTYYVPTLMPRRYYTEVIGKGILTAGQEAKARETLATWGRTVRWSKPKGVKIAFGTDAGVYQHGRNAEEFELMIEKGGTSAQDALVSATKTAAGLLGLENEVGVLEAGKSADIIAVDGDPLTDVKTLQHMAFVMARGSVIDLK